MYFVFNYLTWCVYICALGGNEGAKIPKSSVGEVVAVHTRDLLSLHAILYTYLTQIAQGLNVP